ncbi:MAG: glycosyltransferase [Paracoccus sp. (in: a-proteobacteria)]|uniref:glycosyltransferase n=1 Tax=Paracoccus sp. TaxID=267 RepID=UPI0026E0A1DE|nr:glycosyltransferase [Paracoccus sp. (in: a-proteobacteria)]MDO5632231.1 glycosyltransferase [Paracoccus sp. (in: a-proteobacteria)]
MRVQMLGLCRFSYVGLRGYQTEHITVEERRAFLYDPARLARRWFLFTRIALPAWQAQTDPDFTLVVMTGPDLPEPYLSRLHELCATIPQLRLALVPPMDRHLPACLAAVQPYIDLSADVIGHFRHDDDDAVAVDYIAKARADFAPVEGLWSREGLMSLDHSRGFMLRAGADGVHLIPRICHNMGVALTIFARPDQPVTALHYDHSKLGKWMPGVSITRPLMFLRTLHDDSDSGSDMGPGHPWPANPEQYPAQLRRRFRINLDDLDGDLRAARGFG